MHFDSHQRTRLNLFHSAMGCSVGDSNSERVTEIHQLQHKTGFPLRGKESRHVLWLNRIMLYWGYCWQRKLLLCLFCGRFIAGHVCRIVRLERSPSFSILRGVRQNPGVYSSCFTFSAAFTLETDTSYQINLFFIHKKNQKNTSRMTKMGKMLQKSLVSPKS